MTNIGEERVSFWEAQTQHLLRPLGHHQTLPEAMGRNLFQWAQDTLNSSWEREGKYNKLLLERTTANIWIQAGWRVYTSRFQNSQRIFSIDQRCESLVWVNQCMIIIDFYLIIYCQRTYSMWFHFFKIIDTSSMVQHVTCLVTISYTLEKIVCDYILYDWKDCVFCAC